MGGFHIGQPKLTDDDSIKLIRAAIDGGINFMDNSWDYNKGQSEIRMGKALKDGYRQKVFLMTKLDGRTKEEATRQINESLQRLQTDHLDLIQHHEIIRFDDPDRIFAENGAQEAVLEAKKAGKVRYIGFTGHKDPHIHLYMLEVAARHNFHFDTVQMPLNVMDAHFPQLWQTGAAKTGGAEDWRAGNEIHGRPDHPEERRGETDGMPALRTKPADFRGNYGNRQPGNFAAGF
jgi:predicted aldo/keto reductase-like oxidoreductase